MSSSSLESTPPAPSSSSSKDVSSVSAFDDRIVRFDTECVLIPDPPLRTRKSRFMLWRKRPRSDSVNSDTDVDLFRAPLHRLSRKAPSPSGPASDERPLHSCLVHRDPHEASPAPRPLTRQTSCPPLARPDVATVPLRPCCLACVTVTDDCLLQGENWTEKFTRAARRRRSASVDYCSHGRVAHVHVPSAKQDAVKTTDSVDTAARAFAAVTVDEVDRLGHTKAPTSPPPGADAEETPTAGAAAVGERQGFDGVTEAPRLAHEPRDLLLPSMLSRTNHLSPIPSTNASMEDICTPAASAHAPPAAALLEAAFSARIRIDDAELEDVRVRPESPPSPAPSDLDSPLLSASPSPTSAASSLPRTPPIAHATPASPGSSPRMIHRLPAFHLPSGASFLRAGADMLKGVNVASGSPV